MHQPFCDDARDASGLINARIAEAYANVDAERKAWLDRIAKQNPICRACGSDVYEQDDGETIPEFCNVCKSLASNGVDPMARADITRARREDSATVQVKLTRQERDGIQAAAKLAGMRPGVWMRSVCVLASKCKAMLGTEAQDPHASVP